MKVVLLDAGHGGFNNGRYVTSGKRSPIWEDGSQYFEGIGNRVIRDGIAKLLKSVQIPFHFVTSGHEDVSLVNRCKIVNSFCDVYGRENCYLLSIHSNAFHDRRVSGWEVFTSVGETKSDPFASIIFSEMMNLFPESVFRHDRIDGDVDKESDFYILKNTKCAAVLTENFFYTNEKECREILMTKEGVNKICLAHFKAIVKTINIID